MTGTGMTWHLWAEELKKCIGDFSVMRMKFPSGGEKWMEE